MKKTKKEKSEKKLFAKKEEQVFGEQPREKGIRHVEDAASFLNEINNLDGDFGQAENMLDMWGMSKNEATLRRTRRRRFLGLAIAAVVVILIVSAVFYVLPRVLPDFFKGTNIELFVEKPVHLEYDESYRTIGQPVVSVMKMPDPASQCITQVLYNEPVVLVREEVRNGYSEIMTVDGISGYIKTTALVDDTDSIEPDLHEYKLVVSETSKNIMTHATQGTLITRVNMNTVLYADVKRDGVYQVSLPGGDVGWIGSSGVIEIGPRENIEEVSCRYFVSSALSFVNSRFLENGVTMNGLSINGLVYVCSTVNGIPMPRTIEEQMEMGVEVPLQYDVVTGELITDDIIPGDIIFLDDGAGNYELALCTDTGTLLMRSGARTTIRLQSFDSGSELCSRIVTVRRVFDQ